MLDTFTISCLAIITIFFISFEIYIQRCINNGKLLSNKRWIEQMPSIISTLGVLGTFLGITKGLWSFDTTNLNESIPLLLEGLKTAFFTSLAGMFGSLVLSRRVSAIFDKEDEGLSDINVAAREIVSAVREMNMTNKNTIDELKAESIRQANNQTAFYRNASEVLASIKEYTETLSSASNTIALQAQTQTTILSNINDGTDSIIGTIGDIQENSTKNDELFANMFEKIREIHSYVGEISDICEANASTNNDIAQNVGQFTDRLHGEVIDIENKMDETNTLLSNKFDEFTELLKKSNTEALVDVMKSVTEEFQKQL